MTQPTEDLLLERSSTHGKFEDNARISQELKLILQDDTMTDVQKEAIDMICTKLARIRSGHSHFKDHWDDIAGYARLASNSCAL